jgi:hypothetical protein
MVRDYASEFKKDFEENNGMKAHSIVISWKKDDPDRNYYYADIILSIFNREKFLRDPLLKRIFNSAGFVDATNKELEPWFESTARTVLRYMQVE